MLKLTPTTDETIRSPSDYHLNIEKLVSVLTEYEGMIEAAYCVGSPRITLRTNPDSDMGGGGGTGRKTLRAKYPDGERPRQLRSYEFVVDPAYRIELATTDTSRYKELKQKLEAGLSNYPVSMGESEYLARRCKCRPLV
nr:hypothetical protein [Haloferax profundi]